MNRSGVLLDTNVVSETRRREPHAGVLQVLGSISPNQIFLSVITIGELRRGIVAKRRSDPAAAATIEHWVDELQSRFADRVLPIDLPIANRWGELTAPGAVPVIDALLAATAVEHDLTVITRNVRDFTRFPVDLVDPWSMPPQ